jgi:hypothetical protein
MSALPGPTPQPKHAGLSAWRAFTGLLPGDLACSRLLASGNGPGHDVVDPQDRKIGELEDPCLRPAVVRHRHGRHADPAPARIRALGQAIVGPGYVKVTFGNKQVKDAPSIAPTASCPPATKKRSSKHYGLA